MKVHSIIDVITNSSTEVYPFVTKSSINTIYEMIDSILKTAGSDKKAEDLYDIEIVPNCMECVLERFLDYVTDDCENYDDDLESEENETNCLKKFAKDYNANPDEFAKVIQGYFKIGYNGTGNYENEILFPFLKNNQKILDHFLSNAEEYYGTILFVKAKDGSNPSNLFDSILGSVEYEEIYR